MNTNAKDIIKEMLLELLEFPDYREGSCEEDCREYSVNEDEIEAFCSDKAEEILQGKYEFLDDIQEEANGYAEDCYRENLSIYNEAMEDVYRR